ncbi:MAG: hypothetical protein SGJ21_05385 [Alphaproteobacteria bacterium]|nr:hypothetical protein [Alphaproteobacteria bacterium]
MATVWQTGRGKMGPLAPLIGAWRADAETPMGPVACLRAFAPILGGKFVQLDAEWQFRAGEQATLRAYRERAVFGPDQDGVLAFWSFTSDGKRSQGRLADGSEIHEKALCFEARMTAGLARQAYFPKGEDSMGWRVEAQTKKGWRVLSQHLYTRVDASAADPAADKP